MPDFSVVIPFFNSEKTLNRAISSVLSQSFRDWELVLVNDGSTDSSEDVAKFYLSDSRISCLSQANKGVSAARNLGAKQSKGEWLIFLDSDDELALNSLDVFITKIRKNGDYDFFSAGFKRVSGNKIFENIPHKDKYYSRLSGTFLINRLFFLQVEGYDENLKFSENTELFHRINLAKGREVILPFISLIYHEQQAGGSKNLQNRIDSLSYFLDKHSLTLTDYVKFLYHQMIGVSFIRFQKYSMARIHLWKAYNLKPLEFGTLGRFLISCTPPIAKMLYPKEVC